MIVNDRNAKMTLFTVEHSEDAQQVATDAIPVA